MQAATPLGLAVSDATTSERNDQFPESRHSLKVLAYYLQESKKGPPPFERVAALVTSAITGLPVGWQVRGTDLKSF
jgi:hypothetical protein